MVQDEEAGQGHERHGAALRLGGFRKLYAEAAQGIHELADAAAEDREEVKEHLDRLRVEPTERPSKICTLQIGWSGWKSLNEAATAWRVPSTAIFRFFLAEGLARYGFESKGVLNSADQRAIGRHPDVNRPYQTRSEASRKSRGPTLDNYLSIKTPRTGDSGTDPGPDDAPWTPPLHRPRHKKSEGEHGGPAPDNGDR